MSTSTISQFEAAPRINSQSIRKISPSFSSDQFDLSLSSEKSTKLEYQTMDRDASPSQSFSCYFSPLTDLWPKVEQTIQNTWLMELCACGGSILAFLAIVLLLRFYDDRTQPDWPYNISINFVISLSTTLIKALLIIPITACLSQTNWTHSRIKPHAVKDFLVYDSASRGPRGSLHLLYRFKLR